MITQDATVSKISATEARQTFGNVIKRVYTTGERLMVEKNDLPVVVILSVQDFEQLRRAAALQNLENLNREGSRIAELQGLTPEQLEYEIEQAQGQYLHERYG